MQSNIFENSKLQKVLAIALLAAANFDTVEATWVTPDKPGFFRGRQYREHSAWFKHSVLWAQILNDESSEPVADHYEHLDELMGANVNLSFDVTNDELNDGRIKVTHGQGVVGTIKWEDLGNHNYTGLYTGGSDYGIIRLSEANFVLPEATGLTPTLAMKFSRDGIRSVNYVANTSFEPSTSWNFFANDFKTTLDLFTQENDQKTLGRKFLEHGDIVHKMGLAEFGHYSTDGTEVSVPHIKSPFDLVFKPNQAMKALFPETRQYDKDGDEIKWWEQLKEDVPHGSTLFEVWAVDSPNAAEEHIANIKLTSSTLVTSEFGDLRLYFQHEVMDLDFAIHPEWSEHVMRASGEPWGKTDVPYWPEDPAEAKAWVRGSMKAHQCPFAWLLGKTFEPITGAATDNNAPAGGS